MENNNLLKKGYIVVKDPVTGTVTSVKEDDGRYQSGELVPYWKGLKHSPETINKIKAIYKVTGHQQGEKNSHYNTCWVYNEETGENKCIQKTELETYLSNGYKKGRKLNLPNDKVSSLDKDLIMKMREEGKTWKEIYKDLGIGKNTLKKFRQRNGLWKE